MAITTKDVKMVAELSRLDFSDSELEKMRTDMEAILKYMEDLKKVDTSKVEDNYKTHANLREDNPSGSIKRDELLKNAPKTDGTSFVVPQVVE